LNADPSSGSANSARTINSPVLVAMIVPTASSMLPNMRG
jgi:hypothetical protein